MLNSIAQAPTGLSFGQLLRGDASEARGELQRRFKGKGRSSSVPAIDADDLDEEVILKLHLLARLKVQHEPVFTLIDSGAIPNVLSKELSIA